MRLNDVTSTEHICTTSTQILALAHFINTSVLQLPQIFAISTLTLALGDFY